MHEGGFTMRAHADMTFTFFQPDGSVVPQSPDLGGGDPHALVAEHRDQQLEINDRTCTTLWDGTSISYEKCVWALLTEGGMLAKQRRGPPGTGR
jgi:hypothetical protein